jgi:KipI family sensor histidine kinase inhibitor
MIRVGETACLLRLESSAQVLAAFRAASATPPATVRDVVPGARTLLVIFDEPPAEVEVGWLRDVAGEAAAPLAGEAASPGARVHEIAVRYDGDDLEDLARHAGLAVAEVVARHAGAAYRVAFVGFQPGFAYLEGLPRELWMPRRASPRARVPAGSVAIGGEWTGIYPGATPGGWNLIGRTAVALFDPAAARPALLEPGDVVRMVPE